MAENKNVLTSQLIDLGGLSTFWGKAKEYVDGLNTAMDGRVSTLEGDVADLKTTVNDSTNGLVKKVADLTGRVDGHDTAIGDLQDSVKALLGEGTEGGSSISEMIESAINDFNNNTVTPIDTRVSTLEGTVNDSTNGLVKKVADLRNDVNAIPTAISGAIQGLNPENKPNDAGEFVTGASVNSDGKLVLTYGNAKSWTNEIDAAKTHAETKANAAESNAKTYTDAHISATYNVPGSDPAATASIHLTAGERENWNKAKSDIDTFLAQAGFDAEGKNVVDTLKELQDYITNHGADAAGLLEEINNLKKADETLSAADATNLAAAKAYAKAYADVLLYETAPKEVGDDTLVLPDYDKPRYESVGAESRANTYTDTTVGAAVGSYASDGVGASGLRGEIATAEGNAKTYTDGKLASIVIAGDDDILGIFTPAQA